MVKMEITAQYSAVCTVTGDNLFYFKTVVRLLHLIVPCAQLLYVPAGVWIVVESCGALLWTVYQYTMMRSIFPKFERFLHFHQFWLI